jgi:hypothetical protein
MPAKGEFEVQYFGGPDNPAPCGGVNYAAPYTAIPPNDLAPGSVNTQNINGFLCSSPWVAQPPYNLTLASGEFIMGVFEATSTAALLTTFVPAYSSAHFSSALVVTNIAVYLSQQSGFTYPPATQLAKLNPTVVHTWTVGQVNQSLAYPGQAVTFIQSGGIVYFTGLMLAGVFAYGNLPSGGGNIPGFIQCTAYVCGRYIAELAGRLVIGECLFPGGGGTGGAPNPTVAWSGVGIFGQAWDGNPAHDVWNAANLNFFDGNIGGFNLLGDVPDQITGMGTVGQSIIIVRNNGLTQQDPNSTFSSSGIQPFNWYHMWSSTQGVGGFTGTTAQFGQVLAFLSSDNVYTLSMSGGLSAIGPKIISKIIMDRLAVASSPTVLSIETGGPSGAGQYYDGWWYFASIYMLDGQLHYLLTFSAVAVDNPVSPTEEITTCYAYDMNMTDGSWHVWDLSQYYQQSSAGSGFLGFSCPLVPQTPAFTPSRVGNSVNTISNLRFFLFGAFTAYNTLTTGLLDGALNNLVPFDYDFTLNPITNYVSLLYAPIAVPNATIVFRGETISLGHKISVRRIRLQTDNAPMPTVVTNAQQQAQITLTGAGHNSKATSPIINLQGNVAPTGLAIQTSYGSVVLSDEMVQPSLTSVFAPTVAWQTLSAFRIASASLIGIDATSTTQ